MKSIELSMSYGDMGPAEVSKEHYPSFHYEGPEKLDIPEEGTMTVRYKKTGSSSSKNADGKERHSCTIEVQAIEEVEGEEVEAPSHKYNDSEDALDKLMEEKMKNKKKEY
jgi:hypothetical protein